MRSKGIAPLRFALVAAVLYAAPAYAQTSVTPNENGVTLEAGVSQGRLDPNYGIDIAPEKTVERNAFSYTYDDFTVALRTFTVLSPESHQGLGDEQQLGLIYHSSDQTRLGTFAYQASITYRALNMGHGSGTGDDYVEAAGQLSYPVKITGSWMVTPYVRAVKDIPVGHNNPLFWGMGGIRFDIPVLSDARLYVDATSVHDVNSETAVPHKNVWYAETGVSRKLWFKIVGTLGASYTEYSERDALVAYIPEADGRLVAVPRLAKDRTRPGPKLFVELLRHF